MPTGQLCRWNEDRGFGFIKHDDGGDDVFAHRSELENPDEQLRDGDILEFDVSEERNGKPRAKRIMIQGGGGGRSRRDRSRSRSRRRDHRSRSRGRRDDRHRSRSRGRGYRSRSRGRNDRRDDRRGGRDRKDYKSDAPKDGVTGELKKFRDDKGFGFISQNDGGEDVFFHVSEFDGEERDLREGCKMEYDIEFDDRSGKDRAKRVKLAADGGDGGSGERARSYGRD